MKLKKKLTIYLIILAVVDMIIPIPIVSFILIYVVLERPPWFENLTQEIYQTWQVQAMKLSNEGFVNPVSYCILKLELIQSMSWK